MHRDFKPANVLIGSDGRARVVDFGLARSTALVPEISAPSEAGGPIEQTEPSPKALIELTRTGSLVGTPGYMSPEQLVGQELDARSDQFSFSVALYRGLFGQRPFAGEELAEIAAEVSAGNLRPPPKSSRVPPWLQKAVLRGLAVRPEDRWPTMDAMLAALQYDPARKRRRWIYGAVAAVVVAALALPLVRSGERPCRGAERKLENVWDAATRTRVHAAFAAAGGPDVEAAYGRVERAFDAWAHAFTVEHVEACEATRVRHELSEDVLDLRMQCLGQQLDDTRAQVALMTRADRAIVARSARLMADLPSPTACGDLAALRAPVRPPTDPAVRAAVEKVRKELAGSRALFRVGRYDEADASLRTPLAEARSTGYRPVEAEVLDDVGYVLLERGRRDEAEAVLFDAVEAARAGRHAVIEVAAWTQLVRAAAQQSHYEEAQRRGRYGLAAFESIGSSDQRPLARLLLAIGTAAADQGRYEEALANDRRALAIREAINGLDPASIADALEAVARVLGNLARYEEAERHIRRALAIWEREVGRDSPSYASSLFNLAFALGGQARYEEALAVYRRNLDIWERSLGPEHPRIVLVLTNIGGMLGLLGRYDEALVYERRALALAKKTKGPDHPDVGLALSNIADLLRLQHKYDESFDDYRRAIAIWQPKLTPDHPYFVGALTGLGELELDRKQPARALPSLTQALAIAEKRADDVVPLAEARFALARAEWDSGADHARARARARAARLGYAGARAQEAQLAAVDEWLAKHQP